LVKDPDFEAVIAEIEHNGLDAPVEEVGREPSMRFPRDWEWAVRKFAAALLTADNIEQADRIKKSG